MHAPLARSVVLRAPTCGTCAPTAPKQAAPLPAAPPAARSAPCARLERMRAGCGAVRSAAWRRTQELRAHGRRLELTPCGFSSTSHPVAWHQRRVKRVDRRGLRWERVLLPGSAFFAHVRELPHSVQAHMHNSMIAREQSQTPITHSCACLRPHGWPRPSLSYVIFRRVLDCLSLHTTAWVAIKQEGGILWPDHVGLRCIGFTTLTPLLLP
jgi:hypothetical protein